MNDDKFNIEYCVVGEGEELSGGISKYVTEEEKAKLKALTGFAAGDTLFFVADEKEKAIKYTNVLRNELGKELELIDENDYKFCWIVDFPFFEKDDDGNIEFSHNPFSLPQSSLEEIKKAKDNLLTKANELATKVYEEAAKNNQNETTETKEDDKSNDDVVDAEYEEK